MIIIGKGHHFNISLYDLVTCKEYRITESGYVYRDFFLIEELINNNNDYSTSNYYNSSDEVLLHLKFYVITPKDAHILLSEKDFPKKDDKVYEIVIGAGNNKFSTIRPKIGVGRLAIITKSEILSPIDPTPIELYQYLDGSFEVIIPGLSIDPYMRFKDISPLHIKYISFTTFGSTLAKWFYDCNTKADENDEIDHISIENKTIPTRKKLINDIYKNYNYYSPPNGLKYINFSFQINGIAYNLKNSILTTRIAIKMKWIDETLRWNPYEYDNISKLTGIDYEFWTPTLIVPNGAESSHQDFSPQYVGTVYYNGSIEVRTIESILNTWCNENNYDKWPNDILNCQIELGIHHSNIKLIYDDNELNLKRKKIITELSEWHLRNIKIQSSETDSLEISELAEINKKLFQSQNDSIFNYTFAVNYNNAYKADLVIQLQLKRNQEYYRIVFFTPLIVSSILLLLSFNLDDSKRGGLNLISMFIIFIAFLILTKHVPNYAVPKLVFSYKILLYSSCCTYFLHVAIIWLKIYPPIMKPKIFIIEIINFTPLRFMLGMQISDGSDYLHIQEFPWHEIAVMLNRISFILLSFVILWIFLKGY